MPSGKSEAWRERDRRVLWHPFTQQKLWMEEEFPVIVKGEGTTLVDADGRTFLDGVSSIWCNVLGHGRKEINAAMKAQIGKLAHATFLGLSNPPAIELAERLVELAPPGLERVFYSDNGSTAMEVAVKMAFQYWQHRGKPDKTKFVVLEEAYHGDTLGTVSLGGIDLFHGVFKPLLFPTIKAPTTYAYRCDRADTLEECGAHCLADLEAILRTHGHEVAAMAIEPLVQGAGGILPQPPGFLAGVRKLCDEHDVLLIADEVMTGFGRTGKMFACDHEGVTPDLMALSKGLTNGTLPLAATLAKPELYDAFLGEHAERKVFYHGHTFTGNPLACSAAIATLDLFRKDKVIQKLEAKIENFEQLLAPFRDLEHVGDVRQRGLVAGIELVADKETKEPFPYDFRMGHRVILEARRRGVILRPVGDVLILMPPLVIKQPELKRLCRVAFDSIQAAVA